MYFCIFLRSETCSSNCETGQQFRTIFCDRNAPNTERCDIRATPNIFKECTQNRSNPCYGEWFIGNICTWIKII